MLPRPANCFAPAPRPSNNHIEHQFKPAPVSQQQTVTQDPAKPAEAVKKVGLIPYSLMSHKPKEGEKLTKKKDEDSESDEEEQGGSFFTFSSKDEDLPSCEDEVNALVAKETARMEQRKRQNDETEPQEQQYENYQSDPQQQQQSVDEEAMRQLLGGNKAKRSRVDNIQFIDLTAADVMPNRDEWLRKTLAGETSYMPTGNIVDKVSNIVLVLLDVYS
jgi:proline-rich protein PRCC